MGERGEHLPYHRGGLAARGRPIRRHLEPQLPEPDRLPHGGPGFDLRPALAIGYRTGGKAPIFADIPQRSRVVDPIVQALTLTDVVVEATVVALLLALVIQASKRYGTSTRTPWSGCASERAGTAGGGRAAASRRGPVRSCTRS